MEKENIKNKKSRNTDYAKESLNNFLSPLKKFWRNIYDVVLNNEKDFWVVFILFLGTLFLSIFLGLKVYNNIKEINKSSSELIKLDKYKITETIKSADFFRPFVDISDIIEYSSGLKDDKFRYNKYLSELSTSYEYLLQYIYLPRLNIWKDLYIDKIHTDMIGIKFIKNNPYGDSALVNKWSSFFEYVGENNESNKVLDMSVGNFIEDENGFFSIPISVSFESNSKRSFLLLLDKLLVTSSQENVGLINEFMYYLIQNIKENKPTVIDDLITKIDEQFGSGSNFHNEDSNLNQNKVIGYVLYDRIFGTGDNLLLDEQIINSTVKDVAFCDDSVDMETCYYRFRDKYRNIPEIAYNLGRVILDVDRTEYLKKFLKNLPPIISIKDLSFNKVRSESVIGNNMQYKGKISISVFGKGISSQEVDEIANELGEQCFGEGISLNITLASNKVSEYINKLSGINDLDFKKSKNLRELDSIFKDIDTEYESLTNYNKIIKLFEIYRMLDDASLCTN
ncbi:hypothetical protein K9M48_02620 [Candidatus Gracilibacteria bacterium]|nr:hypothetical protein [Candidatus Gracilibacteria bacterium]